MRALVLVAALLAAPPALAEMNRNCQALLDIAVAQMKAPSLTGRYSGTEGDWCVFKSLHLKTPLPQPDFAADTLRLRGTTVTVFLLGEVGPAAGLDAEVKIDGLRLVPKTGQSQFDYLLQMQSGAQTTSAEVALRWDKHSKELSLTRFEIDFPGDNAVSATARIGSVDLSTTGAMQMSVASFAIRQATLDITSNGLFESTLLLPLGALMLPQDGDMAAAADALRDKTWAGIAALPDATFSVATKDALSQLVAQMPNPAGTLSLVFDADGGFGPARLAGFALYGVPRTIAEAAPLFRGVTLDATWTPQGQQQADGDDEKEE